MKKKLISITAMVAIAIGLYGAAGEMLATPDEAKPEHVVVPESTLKVWFAQQEIKAGDPVSRDVLALKSILESEANHLGISEDIKLEFVKGAVFDRAILVGEAVFPEEIITPQDIEFIDLVIKKDRIPFAIKVKPNDIIGGLIKYGSYIDILAFSDVGENLAANSTTSASKTFKSMSVSPVLMEVKVLQVRNSGARSKGVTEELKEDLNLETKSTELSLVLELTRKQLAKLTIAQRVAELQIHKSIGDYDATDLTSNAGDVLPYYKAIKEFRADKITIN